jgi:hypothetical protein
MSGDDGEIRELIARERARSFDALKGIGSVLGTIQFEEIRKVGESFKLAMNRVFLLQGFPGAMQRYAQYHFEWPLRISQRVIVHTAKHGTAPNEQDAEQIQREVQRELDADLAFDTETVKDSDIFDYRVLAKLSSSPAVAMGREAHLASVIIQGWMCFEILCGDIWIPAVNASPDVLGKNVNASLPKDQKVSWDDLARVDFNLRRQIGTVFARRLSFQSLDKIRKAFTSAFRDDYKSQMQEVFDDPALLRLERSRHLLVHKAGRIDAAFAQANRNDANWGTLTVGEELKITDAIATESWTVAAIAGSKLLDAVNSWLVTNVELPKIGPMSDFEI